MLVRNGSEERTREKGRDLEGTDLPCGGEDGGDRRAFVQTAKRQGGMKLRQEREGSEERE